MKKKEIDVRKADDEKYEITKGKKKFELAEDDLKRLVDKIYHIGFRYVKVDYGNTVKEAVDLLKRVAEDEWRAPTKIFTVFNDEVLNASDSVDEAYVKVCGMTYDELEKRASEARRKREDDQRKYKDSLPETVAKYEKLGLELVDEDAKDKFKADLKGWLGTMYRDYIVKCSLELIKMARDGETVEKMEKKFYSQGQSGLSGGATLSFVSSYCKAENAKRLLEKLKPEFFEDEKSDEKESESGSDRKD